MSLPCERECCEHLHLHIFARSSSVENLTTTHGTFFYHLLVRALSFHSPEWDRTTNRVAGSGVFGVAFWIEGMGTSTCLRSITDIRFK